MRRAKRKEARCFLLGIECGGTRTVSLLVPDGAGKVVRIESGPANLRLLSDPQLARHFAAIRERHENLGLPAAIGIGMAGARTGRDAERIGRAAGKVWPGVPCRATDDLETALLAARMADGNREFTRVLVLSGTGSCCFGRVPGGAAARAGGWGHLLGDRGSGYDIGLSALKQVIGQFDRKGVWPLLGRRLLQWLQLNEPDDLIAWAQRSGKPEIAALAVPIGKAAVAGDPIAARVFRLAAEALAEDAIACARKLSGRGAGLQFVLSGGVLLGHPGFQRRVKARLRARFPKAEVKPLSVESAWGAVELARTAAVDFAEAGTREAEERDAGCRIDETLLMNSPTERRNPRSAKLHRMPVPAMIELMLREEACIAKGLFAERRAIAKAIGMIVEALRSGGRLIYAGAGTSGRLGVLDASECPPTFGTPPEMVQGIIAGGQSALWRAVEGAEDDREAGARAIRFAGAGRRDVVVGITASGRAPFVHGALAAARRAGARAVLLCFNPAARDGFGETLDLALAPEIGPEVLTGSTRLKCGTATKLVLNMLTTISMVRLGKVAGNLMRDLKPSNSKLRGRAVRIVCEMAGVEKETARVALEKARWVVADALKRL